MPHKNQTPGHSLGPNDHAALDKDGQLSADELEIVEKFVEKMGSVEKAREVISALKELQDAA